MQFCIGTYCQRYGKIIGYFSSLFLSSFSITTRAASNRYRREISIANSTNFPLEIAPTQIHPTPQSDLSKTLQSIQSFKSATSIFTSEVRFVSPNLSAPSLRFVQNFPCGAISAHPIRSEIVSDCIQSAGLDWTFSAVSGFMLLDVCDDSCESKYSLPNDQT